MQPYFGLTIPVVGKKTEPSLSVVLTENSPKYTRFVILERTVPLKKFIRLRAYMLAFLLVNVLLSITLLKLGVGSLCLSGIILMEALSGSKFLTS